jgi:hypothetical protein
MIRWQSGNICAECIHITSSILIQFKASRGDEQRSKVPPPKHTFVGRDVGSFTMVSMVPSGAIRRIHEASQRAFHKYPSESIALPSGTPYVFPKSEKTFLSTTVPSRALNE